jgi:hypothetical protein
VLQNIAASRAGQRKRLKDIPVDVAKKVGKDTWLLKHANQGDRGHHRHASEGC